MSATRDKNQKVTFVYSNLYQIYRKGKDATVESNPAQAPAANAPVNSPVEGDFARPFSVEKDVARGLTTSKILKAADSSAVVAETRAAPQVHEFKPAELMAKRLEARTPVKMGLAPQLVNRPASLPKREGNDSTIASLKQNLQSLNDLHSRLRFMLQELEELVKE
jgi:hypothetical protein